MTIPIERHHSDFLRQWGIDDDLDRRNIPRLLESGWSMDEVAEVYRVSVRTVQRYAKAHQRCPGERCLTMTPGGRLCHFDRRTRALEGAA